MDDARAYLDKLRVEQYVEYSHDEFVKVLKNRIRRWTGDSSIMFANEERLVEELKRLKQSGWR